MNPSLSVMPDNPDIPVAAIAILPETMNDREREYYIHHFCEGVKAYDDDQLPTAYPRHLNPTALSAWFDGYWSAHKIER